MLQFLTSKSDRYTIAEEAQMAIEGGCQWVQVTNSLPSNLSLKEVLTELMPLCEENGTFLMVESNVELVNEMRIHGVLLKKTDISPVEVRELLGPHAVIGLEVGSPEDVAPLKGVDIDYILMEYEGEKSLPLIRSIIEATPEGVFTIHFVAKGEFTPEEFKTLKDIGINGFAVSKQITDADDPVATTKEIIENLTGQA